MRDSQIFALKVDSDTATDVYESLKNGEARFGWSGCATADLHELKARIEADGIGSLTEDERACNQQFLLEIQPNDYVVYINVPTYGQCTLAKVVKPYYWDFRNRDFNHRLGVDPATVRTFDRNDREVHPTLSARLKLQGRWWRVYAEEEFQHLLEALEAGTTGQQASEEDRMARLAGEIGPLLNEITNQVQRTHPRKDLESLIAKLLDGAPGVAGVVSAGSGRADKGADLIVTLERHHPLTGEVDQTVCLIQAKSYWGEQGELGAIEDIRRAFDAYPEADEGLIVSTAERVSSEFEEHLERLREDTGRKVRLVVGPSLAGFVLRHGRDVLTA